MVQITARVTTEETFAVYDVKPVQSILIQMQEENNINIESFFEHLDDASEAIEELGTKKTERKMTFGQFPQDVKDAIAALKNYAVEIAKEDIGLV